MLSFTRQFLLCSLIAASAAVALPARAQPATVRVHTTMGAIDLSMLPDAPVTVANFAAYARAGDYTDVFFHRNAWLNATTPFVIQAGGFRWSATAGIQAVTSRGAIVNEFSPARSNLRGTVAMAKLGGDPNSATSQWFINMGNNAANLDTQNGGFTVFARVTGPGMATADRIAALPNVSARTSFVEFTELPLVGWQSGTSVQRSHVVRITGVAELPVQAASDRIFNYLEAAHPQYFGTTAPAAGEALGYVFRYYPDTNVYVAAKDGTLWYLAPAIDGNVHPLGAVSDWLAAAQAVGY